MRWRWRSLFAPAEAAPTAPATAAAIAGKSDASAVIQVQWWGGRRYPTIGLSPWRGGRAPGSGSAPAWWSAASSPTRPIGRGAGYYYDDYAYDGPYYYPSAYSGDPRAICAQNFRSFEWNTGLYTTYGGEKRLCPYLR